MKENSSRIDSIDILRGSVMVLMALDHVRDYFHINVFTGNDPTDLDTTSFILFFTRFITHYCAPIFIFLAGVSAYLYGQNKPKRTLSYFLLTRGLWLIFIEIVVMNFLWWFDIQYGFINLQVIWAIGCCMVLLSIFIFLPKNILLILGLVLISLHNLLDGIQLEGSGLKEILWYIFYQVQFVNIDQNHMISFQYPILPWLGLMAIGYYIGSMYSFSAALRKRYFVWIGILSILAFFILRGINVYGDPNPWQIQFSSLLTVLSFFNVTKYPPSLDFILITMGPAFLFLAYYESFKNKLADFFIVYGRVPFFYYVLHVFVIHILAILGLIITGQDWELMILNNEVFSEEKLVGYGYPLYVVYLVWILVVLLLYPFCKKFMLYKSRNRHKKWLSYI